MDGSLKATRQKRPDKTRLFMPTIAIAVFAVIGMITLMFSRAATTAVSSETESGTLSGGAGIIADSGASQGSAVKYGSGGAVKTCDLTATTATFSGQVSAATAGKTICLATGNYGTWNGVNKAITITNQAGATASMVLNIGTGDGNFTLDGLSIGGGTIYGNQSNYGSSDRPQNITIRNSAFTAAIDISYIANANIVLDHDTFNNIDTNSNCTAAPARVWVSGNGSAPSGVTLSNSVLSGGNTDGVQAGLPMSIINNEFYNIQEKSASDCSHTDAIQLYGGTSMVIRGNYIHNTADGIVAYDGTDTNTIEDNVIDLVSGRFGIELYSDRNSIVRHNTLVYGTGCAYDPCGGIYLDHKSADPAGSGTIIENNIASNVNLANGSTAATNRNNMLHSGASGSNFNGIPSYSGGALPNAYAGFYLNPGSPGKVGGSDGLDVGIR